MRLINSEQTDCKYVR